ncbi:MAG: hypothetical protein IID36_03065 [Planctomycetes bacterium]|nr:hypothetical protein [Planctomycetota bacterium]
MDPIQSSTALAAAGGAAPSKNSFSALSSEDFFGLLITQLTNQDPFEPTGNEELFNQIASIREIELSTALTESLETLTSQQRFGAASSLIGRFVTGVSGSDGMPHSGIVTGVRFDAKGEAVLQLGDGTEMALADVTTIEAAESAAESLIGTKVFGVDRRDPSDVRAVEGIVTSARTDERGETVVELDTGEDIRFRDVLGTVPDQL